MQEYVVILIEENATVLCDFITHQCASTDINNY
jgi:hypothetical protein